MEIKGLQALMEIQALRQLDSRSDVSRIDSGPCFSDLLMLALSAEKRAEISNPHTEIPQTDGKQIRLTEAPANLQKMIAEAAETYQLPEKLIESVIRVESNFNPDAVSPAGARGLMQLMPATSRSLGVKNMDDPRENVLAGTKYLRMMLDRFGDLELALAAYNAGPGNVEKYGGIPPFEETRKYVKKVMEYFA